MKKAGVFLPNDGHFRKRGSQGPGRDPIPTGGRPVGSHREKKKAAREMIASFIDGNSHRLERWLDEIYAAEGPKAAFSCFADLIEYHVPKLARTEVTGKDEGPIELVVTWGGIAVPGSPAEEEPIEAEWSESK
jgi:hypothetical protein